VAVNDTPRIQALESDQQSEINQHPRTPREWVILAGDIMSKVDRNMVNLDGWKFGGGGYGLDHEWLSDRAGCGTIACAAGHLCAHPTFRTQGLALGPAGPVLRIRNPEAAYFGIAAMARVMRITYREGQDLFGSSRMDTDIGLLTH
jgi:hypothetical protein